VHGAPPFLVVRAAAAGRRRRVSSGVAVDTRRAPRRGQPPGEEPNSTWRSCRRPPCLRLGLAGGPTPAAAALPTPATARGPPTTNVRVYPSTPFCPGEAGRERPNSHTPTVARVRRSRRLDVLAAALARPPVRIAAVRSSAPASTQAPPSAAAFVATAFAAVAVAAAAAAAAARGSKEGQPAAFCGPKALDRRRLRIGQNSVTVGGRASSGDGDRRCRPLVGPKSPL